MAKSSASKVLPLKRLLTLRELWRWEGRRVVFTNGVGIATAPFQLGKSTHDDPIYVLERADDEHVTQALINEIEAFAVSENGELVLDAMEALRREDKEILWSSMVKQTIKRKQPSFSEASYGYGTFSELVEDGARMGLFRITKDERSGSYVMTEGAGEARAR